MNKGWYAFATLRFIPEVKAVEASLYESGKAARKGLLKDDLEPFKRLSELVDDLCRAQQGMFASKVCCVFSV